MAFRSSELPEEEFSCPVCIRIYEDPVLLSCSHSFCNTCLQNWWRENPMQECPLCKRRSSKSKPPCNLVLKNLCEAFLQQRAQRASAGSVEVCSLHSEKLQLFCLDHQQPICLVCRDSERHINHSFRPIDEAAQRHKAEVQKSLEPFKKKLKVLQKAKGDWVQTADQMKVKAKETERQINEEFEKLQKVLQEEQKARICALREEEENNSQMMKEKIEGLNREIKDVSDSIRAVEEQLGAPGVSFLQNYKATVERTQRSLPQEPQGPSGTLLDVTEHLENLKLTSLVEEMQQILRSPRIGCVDPTVATFSALRKYACQLTLDPNTAHCHLSLSEDNRKVTRGERQSYPRHPDRFTFYTQVLCREGLTGRCYWEVDWRGWVDIGVTYRGIRRGGGYDSLLGGNNKSWVLKCRDEEYIVTYGGQGYTATHNKIPTPISVSSVCHRVGVYVDWPAGSLSFYTVSSDTLTHLHTFCCTFTQPLIPGFWVGWSGSSSVSLCQVE